VVNTGVGVEAPDDPEPLLRPVLEQWREGKALCTETFGWVPDRIRIKGDEKALFQALLDWKLRAVSDGSFKNRLGSAAAKLTTKDRRHEIRLWYQAPGIPDDQSVYRSELVGLLSILMVVNWLAARHDDRYLPRATHPRVRVACDDGLSALNNPFSKWPLHPKQAHFDQLSVIRGPSALVVFFGPLDMSRATRIVTSPGSNWIGGRNATSRWTD